MRETGGLSRERERPPVSLMDVFRDLPKPLLFQALTHPHAVADRTESYERLEFLGDSVLGLAVAAHLFRRFEGVEEGRLAKLKAFVVSRVSCAAVAKIVGLPELILHASPVDKEHRTEMVESATMLGNIMEALIGAAFLAFGFDAVAEPVALAFLPRVEYALHNEVDYKSTLQEALAAEGRSVSYSLLESHGPAHNRTFTSAALVDGQELGRGTGKSKKLSEHFAALEALVRLGVLRPSGKANPQGFGVAGGVATSAAAATGAAAAGSKESPAISRGKAGSKAKEG